MKAFSKTYRALGAQGAAQGASRNVALCFALALSFCLALSCRTVPSPVAPSAPPAESRKPLPPLAIMGSASVGEDRLVSFFLSNNPLANPAKVRRLAAYYVEEGSLEGVNPDVAFVQMCLETGFLRFGGLVTEDMNNFCGLGSIGPGQNGNSFPDERTGVRAHVQHLKAYGSTEPLVGEQVDPRYRYVNPKGKAPLVQGLAGTWAADREYGTKLAILLERLYS